MFRENIFGIRIHSLRREYSLTLKQFGELFGLTEQAVSKIETGSRLTSIEKLVAIAEYFQVTTDWLLGLSDERG